MLDHLSSKDDFVIESISSSLQEHTHWQYGVGEHASAPCAILSSLKIPAVSDNGRFVLMRHLVLDVSSQLWTGRNFTERSNNLHIDCNALQFMAHGVIDHFSMTTMGLLSYLLISVFSNEPCNMSALSYPSGILLKDRPWSQIKSIAGKVHKHVCGHANFNDSRLLLERNALWSDDLSDYVSQLIKKCTLCRATAPPQPSRKVATSSLSREFNDVVSVDHFHLDSTRMLHL